MGLQEGKAQAKEKQCLFGDRGGKCYKVLVRVLIETYLIQIANSSPGIRRGKSARLSVSMRPGRIYGKWEVHSYCDLSALHENVDE